MDLLALGIRVLCEISKEKRKISEKIGLEVIDSIIKQNTLTLEDVSVLFENSIQLQQVDNIS